MTQFKPPSTLSITINSHVHNATLVNYKTVTPPLKLDGKLLICRAVYVSQCNSITIVWFVSFYQENNHVYHVASYCITNNIKSLEPLIKTFLDIDSFKKWLHDFEKRGKMR